MEITGGQNNRKIHYQVIYLLIGCLDNNDIHQA